MRRRWTLEEAEGHLAEIIARARDEGPQEIVSDRERLAVIIRDDEAHARGDEFHDRDVAPTALTGSSSETGDESFVDVERPKDMPREEITFDFVNDMTDEEFDEYMVELSDRFDRLLGPGKGDESTHQ